ncbi:MULTISPECIES: hypothetical protein [unclassified Spiroplasma]|uniref:hypothetical protein n=1 Tax=unclassified Spiroplasma TaxID=2637901 RepID=UPI0030D2FD6D
MAKTVIQISQEQQIYLQESLSNKTYKDVCDEFIELCKKLSLDDYEKGKSMMEHFNNFINAQIVGKQELLTCQHFINAKGKISELPWNKEIQNENIK